MSKYDASCRFITLTISITNFSFFLFNLRLDDMILYLNIDTADVSSFGLKI